MTIPGAARREGERPGCPRRLGTLRTLVRADCLLVRTRLGALQRIGQLADVSLRHVSLLRYIGPEQLRTVHGLTGQVRIRLR
jgi:hypothetical protein